MSFWTAVVVVFAIAAWTAIRITRIRSGQPEIRHSRRRDRHGAIEAPDPSPREVELQGEVTELRERIKVLERIATDEHKPQRLAAEIESLRDN